MWFRDLTVLVIAVLVCRGESQSLTRFPPGAFAEPEVFQPEVKFCPRNGMATFVDSPPIDRPSCVPAPGPVLCYLQVMVSGIRPQGTICRNKGYLSGWTRVPPEGGPFYAKCCSSMEYTYSEDRCVTRVRTPEFSGSGLPSYYFPVGGITLSDRIGFSVRYCVFVRRFP
uniref:Uncharacterized protein n=1 Tax=Magallana gigas TaxID=29159 RepID=A0A8W8MG55_MAGGI|nr:uncharacterized protein LOC117684096 [Crassostrea gigas]